MNVTDPENILMNNRLMYKKSFEFTKLFLSIYIKLNRV
jgi:hypothetical protein